eukprot:UN30377
MRQLPNRLNRLLKPEPKIKLTKSTVSSLMLEKVIIDEQGNYETIIDTCEDEDYEAIFGNLDLLDFMDVIKNIDFEGENDSVEFDVKSKLLEYIELDNYKDLREEDKKRYNIEFVFLNMINLFTFSNKEDFNMFSILICNSQTNSNLFYQIVGRLIVENTLTKEMYENMLKIISEEYRDWDEDILRKEILNVLLEIVSAEHHDVVFKSNDKVLVEYKDHDWKLGQIRGISNNGHDNQLLYLVKCNVGVLKVKKQQLRLRLRIIVHDFSKFCT